MSKDNEKESAKLKKSFIFPIIMMLIMVMSLTVATYAWFTYSPTTNVTPMSSTVSMGDTGLLISNSRNGNFDVSCTLILTSTAQVIKPLTTADLDHYYTVTASDQDGIAMLYREETNPDNYLMHGTVYLKAVYGDCDVYFYRPELNLGENSNMVSALRFGAKITTINGGTKTYIFNLDSLGGSSAPANVTITEPGSVVASISENGVANYIKDPSVSIGDYIAEGSGDTYGPGREKLCTLRMNEIATVEYWLYLEGCDENCSNEIKAREVDLQLAFAGVSLN